MLATVFFGPAVRLGGPTVKVILDKIGFSARSAERIFLKFLSKHFSFFSFFSNKKSKKFLEETFSENFSENNFQQNFKICLKILFF